MSTHGLPQLLTNKISRSLSMLGRAAYLIEENRKYAGPYQEYLAYRDLQPEIAHHREVIANFRALGERLKFDAQAVITELGGEPLICLSAEASLALIEATTAPANREAV